MKFVLIPVLAMAGAALAGTAEINSSFEDGKFSGWTTQGKGWSITAKNAGAGKKSAMCMVTKGEAPSLKACARLLTDAGPGWVVKADLKVAGKTKSKSSKTKVVLMCIDAKGNTLREVKKEITSPSAKFEKISLPEIVVPTGTNETYLMIVVEVPKKSGGKEYWYFDDINIRID